MDRLPKILLIILLIGGSVSYQSCSQEQVSIIYGINDEGHDFVVEIREIIVRDTINTTTVINNTDTINTVTVVTNTDTVFLAGQNCIPSISFDMDTHYPDECRLWSKLRVEWNCDPETIEVRVIGSVTRIFSLPPGWNQNNNVVIGFIDNIQQQPLGIDLLNYCPNEEITIEVSLVTGELLYRGHREVIN